MEFMKELSLNMSIANQTFMLLYMSGPAPTNAAELNAAVDTNDFTDMWNKSVGCSYVKGVKSAYAGVGAEWTTFFAPRAGCGQLKGATLRPDGHRIQANLASSKPVVPDTIEYQTADGVKLPSCGWLGLFAAQLLCRGAPASSNDSYFLSTGHVSGLAPDAHIVLGFNEAKTFSGISCESANLSYAVDFWDGSSWVQCVTMRVGVVNTNTLFSATSSKIRLRIRPGTSSDLYGSFVLHEVEAPAVRPHPDIQWSLLIPICARPNSLNSADVYARVVAKEITSQTKIPFYVLTTGGPGGSEEILLTKNTALTSADYPVATGFYIKSGNFVEA